MSFRKRSVVLNTSDGNNSTSATTPGAPQSAPPTPPVKGVRPSFLTGVPTTSTGTASLDALLSGHEGLPLGSMMLIEESSTTDFAGALLRYYAAEGIVQGHNVIVVGVGEAWGRELPGLSDRKDDNEDIKKKGKEERMKIAWRYEALGNRRTTESTPSPQMGTDTSEPASLFCHTYDLTKRLTIPPSSKPPTYIPPPPPTSPSPFSSILSVLFTHLSNASSTNSITRVLIPNLLSPPLLPPFIIPPYPPAPIHPHPPLPNPPILTNPHNNDILPITPIPTHNRPNPPARTPLRRNNRTPPNPHLPRAFRNDKVVFVVNVNRRYPTGACKSLEGDRREEGDWDCGGVVGKAMVAVEWWGWKEGMIWRSC
ncbi:hypothetical protein TWF281_011415 [Arthrobotrys megalospora]